MRKDYKELLTPEFIKAIKENVRLYGKEITLHGVAVALFLYEKHKKTKKKVKKNEN